MIHPDNMVVVSVGPAAKKPTPKKPKQKK